MSQVAVHIANIERERPLNLFSYAALKATRSPTIYTAPENAVYAEELIKEFPRYWQLTSFEEADVIVYAHQYRATPATQALSEKASAAQKTLLFIESSENEPPTSISYGKLYRQSIFGEQRQAHEYSCASMHSDMLQEKGIKDVPVLEKQSRPSISFCGFVGTPYMIFLYRCLRQNQKADGLTVRGNILKAFERSSIIDCRFIRRNRYLGMAPLVLTTKQNALIQSRTEFIDNILESPYGISMRGKGNHSVRFYELLSVGRIPIFINTHCVLPFDDQINYKKHTVWIEYEDLNRAEEIFLDFHQSITSEDFNALQVANRALWSEWLSPLGFHRKVITPERTPTIEIPTKRAS